MMHFSESFLDGAVTHHTTWKNSILLSIVYEAPRRETVAFKEKEFISIQPFLPFQSLVLSKDPQSASCIPTLSRTKGKQIFRLWRFITSSRIGYRKRSASFRHTVKKRQAFGYLFAFFLLWYRFVEWKKQSAMRPDAFSLNYSEYLIDWHVREKFLNFNKARRKRANVHFIKTLI